MTIVYLILGLLGFVATVYLSIVVKKKLSPQNSDGINEFTWQEILGDFIIVGLCFLYAFAFEKFYL